mmetsp:Transcript_15133/g.30791  ORF Transcript_15133/g.30791 Transcript_15133/m.30791 type:complete len:538 (-) Transcript_15133:168-1781(-)
MNEEGGFDLLGVFGESAIYVDDSSASFLGGLSCRGNEVRRPSGDPIVESGPDADEEVAVLNEVIGRGVAVHSQHVGGEGMALVEGAEGVEGGGHGYLEGFGQFHELFGGVVGALSGDDEGSLGVLDEVHHFGHESVRGSELSGFSFLGLVVDISVVDSSVNGVGEVVVQMVGVVAALHGLQFSLGVDLETQPLLDPPQVNRRRVGNQPDEVLIVVPRMDVVVLRPIRPQPVQKRLDQLGRQLLYLQILGQVQEHRPRPPVPRHVKRVIHRERHLGRRLDLVTPLGARPHDVHGRTGLEGVHRGRGGGLAAQHDEGDAVAHGVLDGRDEVGAARARRGHDDAGGETAVRLGGRLGDALGDVAGGGLVGVGDPADLLLVAVAGVVLVELVQEGEDGPAGVAVHDLHAVVEKLGVDDVGGGLAVERVQVLRRGGFGGGFGGRAVQEVPGRGGRGGHVVGEAGGGPDGFAGGGRVGHGGHGQHHRGRRRRKGPSLSSSQIARILRLLSQSCESYRWSDGRCQDRCGCGELHCYRVFENTIL